MNKIKTSVIIPVYNTEKYLDACVESVLAQTQEEIEIILVDDGSTDGSRRIIEKYEKTYSFVKAVFQENQKLGAARNAGVKNIFIFWIQMIMSGRICLKSVIRKPGRMIWTLLCSMLKPLLRI